MLSRLHRLSKEKDIKLVLGRGRGFEHHLVRMRAIKTENITRITFIVSKKAVRRVVDRNRVKRHLREFTRKLLPVIREGFDVVIIGKQGIGNATREQLAQATNSIFSRANLLEKR